MLKKLLVLFVVLGATLSCAFAAVVDVNTADRATLQTLSGIGPAKSKAILDERTKNGPFKDAADLAHRVTGLGTKSVAKLEAEGLTIGTPVGPAGDAGGKRKKTSNARHSQPAQAAAALAAQTPSPSTADSTSKKNKRKSKHRKNAAGAASAGSRA